MKNVLLTNDDGIQSDGLWALYRAFRKTCRVTVVAPDRERSAVGHGITLLQPLRVEPVEVNGGYSGFAVSGTPADCIKLALKELLEDRPDIVVSGINPGANVGNNMNYSGTVSAAKEAALYGLPAIAVSVAGTQNDNYPGAARFVRILADRIWREGLPFGTFLNVNFPDTPVESTLGIRISRQGNGFFSEYFDRRIDPRNRVYYWQGNDPSKVGTDPDVDEAALDSRYISITPVKCDSTDYDLMETLKSWNITPDE